jgi:hypothetical protein
VLAASATTLPLLLALSACAGPDPLDGPPPLSHNVRELLAAIAAEGNLINTYKRTLSAYSALAPTLTPLLTEHEAHLVQLRARVIEPPGVSPSATATPGSASPGSASRRGPVPGTRTAAIAMLRDAEQSASAAQLRRLVTVSGSLAQLFASIAASETTHVAVLDERRLA